MPTTPSPAIAPTRRAGRRWTRWQNWNAAPTRSLTAPLCNSLCAPCGSCQTRLSKWQPPWAREFSQWRLADGVELVAFILPGFRWPNFNHPALLNLSNLFANLQIKRRLESQMLLIPRNGGTDALARIECLRLRGSRMAMPELQKTIHDLVSDLYSRGELEEAAAALSAAIAEGQSAELWSDWGAVQAARGSAPDAELAFRRALRMDCGWRAA